MADNVAITAGAGTTVAADEVIDGTLGTVKVQYVKIMDGTLDGTTKAAVGAFGIAANVTPTPFSSTTGTITTSSSTISASVSSAGGATITISGTYAGVSVIFEASDDSGTTWYPIQGQRADNQQLQGGFSFVLASNSNLMWDFPATGITNIRVRATAYTSGTANVRITPCAMGFETAPTVALAAAPMLEGSATYAMTGTGTVITQDCLLYQSVKLQATGTWTGTITFQASNDNVNWNAVNLLTIGNTNSIPVGTATGNNAWFGNVHQRYFRVQATIAGTGSIVVTAEFSAQSAAYPVVGAAANINNVGGTAVTTNAGAVGAGSQRIVLTNDFSSSSLVRGSATTATTGLSIAKILAAASTNNTNVKAAAAAIYGWHLVNNATTPRYVRFFNLATTATMGTSSPAFVIPLPASGGAVMTPGNMNIALGTGFTYAITAAAADLDATVCVANDVAGTIFYI